jgi:Transcriptional regulator, AbiEi antitoxin
MLSTGPGQSGLVIHRPSIPLSMMCERHNSWAMPIHALDQLLRDQDGVLDNAQISGAGMTSEGVKNQLRYGRWRRLHRGVYAAFSGTPTRRAELWAALLRAGPEAILSHQTAAELYGLLDAHSPVIHITVPHGSNPARCGRIPGIVIHRSRSISRSRHPALMPPRTRVEDTVLDLIESSRSFDEAYGWICRAIGRRRTTAERIHEAMDSRLRMRLNCVTSGASSARTACQRQSGR